MSFTDVSSQRGNDYLSRLSVDGTEFIDHWDTGELLLLASSVVRSDRNWISVQKFVKPYGEQTRPDDFYTAKNCALQYTKLLSDIDEGSKKKTLPRTERETAEVMLVKSLTEKRMNELVWLNQQTKVAANILKTHLEMVENGELDENLDDIIVQIDEQEKRELENYEDYLLQRKNLNAVNKLNKSRVIKGKAISKPVELKKKIHPFPPNLSEDLAQQAILDSVKNIKTDVDADDEYLNKPVKLEVESPTLNALLDNKVTLPTSVAPTSPLLTSLLRNITSSASSSSTTLVTSAMKEEVGDDEGRKEVSPRSRPGPASSPLLNSLLKNTPSTPITPHGKEGTSPQPFFNPSNAQQILASSLPQFLQQQESLGKPIVSPSNLACLSAPTLSKLLEMPPSTPGRLPPLPTPDIPLEKLSPSRPNKVTPSKEEHEFDCPVEFLLKNSESKRSLTSSLSHADNSFKNDTPLGNIDLIQEVSDSYEQAFEIKKEIVDDDDSVIKSEVISPVKDPLSSPGNFSKFLKKSQDADEDADNLSSKNQSENEALDIKDEIMGTEDDELADSSPSPKKLRLFDKMEVSEDDASSAVRRSGRKGKKGRGRPPKIHKSEDNTKDQYEFSDTTDDNMVEAFPKTLCYMPRVKDEDTKDSEDSNLASVEPNKEKKTISPPKIKQEKAASQQILSTRKALFTSDEEQMSDYLPSDDASSHLLSEDKLKKWEETCGKDQTKASSECGKILAQASKSSLKKKVSPAKRTSAGGADGQERKLSAVDSEELSACSRDSEDTSGAWQKDGLEEKSNLDMEVETSSSVAAESDVEKLGEMTPFVTPRASPIHSGGKQKDWLQGTNIKNSEYEESEEDENENWDSQSGSTSKSVSLTSSHSRSTRSEKESSQNKQWKKSINIVLSEISSHKYASVFNQRITDANAPGYLNIVYRPMYLSLIKRNIETGQISTTQEFYRDILLMFQNAIMYNSSEHNIYKMAVEMRNDVVELINAFIKNQSTDAESNESISILRGGRKSQKGKQPFSVSVKDASEE